MKSPSFNFYPNNWLASGRLATMLPEQEGAYIRLLCYQWNSEDQTIPEDDRQLAMLSRLADRWSTLGREVKQCFERVPEISGRLRNERLWHEYNRIQVLRVKKSTGGKKGMANRWAKEELQDTNKTVITKLQDTNKTVITGNREQGTGNREAESETENKTPIAPKGDTDSAFETWYSQYPNKIGRMAAERSWKKHKSKMPHVETMIEKLEEQKRSKKWQEGYIPNPSTYLNQGRWDDLTTTDARPSLQPRTDVDPSLRIKGYGQAVTLESRYGGDDE